MGICNYPLFNLKYSYGLNRILLLFLLIFFHLCDIYSQNYSSYRFKHLTIADGISSNQVTDIIQDTKGYLWIGTVDGLNRFDGYNFKVYKKNPLVLTTIESNHICCLYEDSKGNIWIGLQNSIISKFNPKLETFTNYPCVPQSENTLMDGDVSGIVEDKDGWLWIAIDRKGIAHLDPLTGNFEFYEANYKDNNSLSHNAVTSISMDRDEQIWITTWGGGLNRFDTRNKEFIHYMNDEEIPDWALCKHLKCLCHDSKGNVWVGSDHGGLYYVNKQTKEWEQYSINNQIIENFLHAPINDIIEDENGFLWITTTGSGSWIFDPQARKFIYQISRNENRYFHTNDVTSVYKDMVGSMWLGTDQGLYFYNPVFMNFNKHTITDWDNGAKDDYIWSMLKLKDGRLWVKGQNDLLGYDNSTGLITSQDFIKPYLGSKRKLTMFQDQSENVWFGSTDDMIGIYNPKQKEMQKIRMLSPWKNHVPFRFINTFYEDMDGSIWIGSEIGLLNYNPQNKKFTPLFQSEDLIKSEEKVNCIIRDSYGDLWVGTRGGLKHYDHNNKLLQNFVVNPSEGNSICDNYVTSICEDKKRTLWVGTRGGLHRFNRNDNTFSLVTRPGEVLGDAVMQIVEDDANSLWISSTIGIIQFDYASNKFHVYTESDGLQSNVFNEGVGFKDETGRIFFGGINGFNSFNSTALIKNTSVPSVYITGLQIFNKNVLTGEDSILKSSIEYAEEIVLEHWQSMFSFNFVALDYLASNQNQYAYKLEGFDKQWIHTTSDNRRATYTNIPPGNYIFKVKASNNNDVWNENGAQIRVVILPPIWKTWWAYSLYVLLGIVLFVLILYYFVHKEKVKAKIDLERLEAKHQHEADELKLQLFTNLSHEFRTSLTLIMGPLEYIMHQMQESQNKSLFELMHRNSSRLMRLINQLLDFRKIEANKLQVHLVTQNIVPFLKDVFDTFLFHAKQKEIDYSFHSSFEEMVMDVDLDKTDKILYNLLSNAFNYTDKGGRISVVLDKILHNHEAFISIKVSDNGIGISPESLKELFTLFYQVKENRNKYRGGSGLGLNMTKELVSILNGYITVDSELNKGATFTVLLPIVNSNIESSEQINESVILESDVMKEKPMELSEISKDSELILLVEDNVDMLMFLKSILSSEYRIIEAQNGLEGMEKALEFVPDIIISDVMMPLMDGMEFLTKIKNDERINHIPVILLTAVNEEQKILDSFNVGVDDYITKPFNASILKARVTNILTNRKKWWEKYVRLKNNGNEANENSDYEEKYLNPFITKMTDIISKNLSNPEFNLEELSSDLCMSTSQLTRKTKAILNMTPYNVIIKSRMEYAIKEIRNTDKTISEIAMECGYLEISNFSRAFTKYYGMTPTQYKKQ